MVGGGHIHWKKVYKDFFNYLFYTLVNIKVIINFFQTIFKILQDFFAYLQPNSRSWSQLYFRMSSQLPLFPNTWVLVYPRQCTVYSEGCWRKIVLSTLEIGQPIAVDCTHLMGGTGHCLVKQQNCRAKCKLLCKSPGPTARRGEAQLFENTQVSCSQLCSLRQMIFSGVNSCQRESDSQSVHQRLITKITNRQGRLRMEGRGEEGGIWEYVNGEGGGYNCLLDSDNNLI